MDIKKFDMASDYQRVLQYLENCYRENKNMTCWLPERLDDLLFRLDVLYQERKTPLSRDFIYIWEENGEIAALLLPDGDSFNSCIKTGYEAVFPQMLDLGEKALLPLFDKNKKGEAQFLVISHDSLTYQAAELRKRGYKRQKASDYDNVQHPLERAYQIALPAGFQQIYGQNIDDSVKAKACYYGFNDKADDGVLTGDFAEGYPAYQGRKKSSFFADSFESLIVKEDNADICAYSFCYVNRELSTAYIEPVCTRKAYRRQGFCRQMLYGVLGRLKQMGIENAYINSYDWRKNVYNSAGFQTIDSIGFWIKKIK